MTDIWDEKPEVNIGIDASDFTYKYYSGVEMDAWLEKLQEEYDELDGNVFGYFSMLNDIKKWEKKLHHLDISVKERKKLREILVPFQASSQEATEEVDD